MFDRPIAPSLSPNTEIDDIVAAIKVMMNPLEWKIGNAITKVEKWFQNYYSTDAVFSFNSGRSALIYLLKSFDIGSGDEVIVQAFTCVAVPSPILWTGAKPVYADIDQTFNIDPVSLDKSITKKTRAIIVQHTFGTPARMDLITKIAQKHNLVLIEDCAHSIGSTYKGKKVGSFGDAAFFSFGRDKVISSVFGGMAMISSKFKDQSSKMRIYHQQLTFPSSRWIFQQLFHPILFAFILPLYNLAFGKLILYIALQFQLLSRPVENLELKGKKPSHFAHKYPNALAQILLVQLEKLKKMNINRKKIAYYYRHKLNKSSLRLPKDQNGSIHLRFNVLNSYASQIRETGKKRGILLGNWYHHIIDPKGAEFDKIGYKKGSCPNAEKFAQESINLPTYISLTKKQQNKIISFLNSYDN